MLDFKIVNIEKQYKEGIYNLIKAVNKEDNSSYSLSDEWLDYVIENAGEGIFLGFYKNKLLGLGTAMINSVYKNQASLNLIVHPDYRKKGLGSLLYSRIDEFLKSKEVNIVECFTKKRLKDGVAFAGKKGFTTTMYSWEMELALGSLELNFKKKEELNFRKAKARDGKAYKRIIYDAFGDELEESTLGELLKDPSITTYILEEENKALGTGSIQIIEDLSLGYIYDIAILKEYRGKGLGSYLLKSCIRTLEEKGLSKASLLVTGNNENALGLYKKLGFKEVDIDLIMLKEI